MSNIQSQISNLQSQLESAYPKDEARSLAWWIAEELSGLSRTQLLCGCKDTTFLAHTQAIIERLLHFEPIQYIFGHTLWCGLDLLVTPATLIPRPETAELVEKIDRLRLTEHRPSSTDRTQTDNAPIRVLDIGTGSGCIAIALKKAHPEWQVTGIDISPEAIEVARANAKRNNVEVEFEVADILGVQNTDRFTDRIQTDFDIVVSNPPYICESEKVSMKPNVLDYEPASALFVPDSDPLRFYRRIAELFSNQQSAISNQQSPLYLFFEINEAYPDEVAALLTQLGYQNVRIHRDIYGKPRIAEGQIISHA
jgi:release factor glutamine methyltransferase